MVDWSKLMPKDIRLKEVKIYNLIATVIKNTIKEKIEIQTMYIDLYNRTIFQILPSKEVYKLKSIINTFQLIN